MHFPRRGWMVGALVLTLGGVGNAHAQQAPAPCSAATHRVLSQALDRAEADVRVSAATRHDAASRLLACEAARRADALRALRGIVASAVARTGSAVAAGHRGTPTAQGSAGLPAVQDPGAGALRRLVANVPATGVTPPQQRAIAAVVRTHERDSGRLLVALRVLADLGLPARADLVERRLQEAARRTLRAEFETALRATRQQSYDAVLAVLTTAQREALGRVR